MTMTPEELERAHAVWLKIEDSALNDEIAVIASAIREAEDAALERAAQLALEGHDEAWGNPAEQHGWLKAAECARSLKHNKD